MIARFSRRRPASNHDIKIMNNLEFQPQRGSPSHITTVATLGDNSFQAALPGDFIEFDASLQHMVGIANGVRGPEQFAQQTFARLERDLTQIVTIAIEQVVREKGRW